MWNRRHLKPPPECRMKVKLLGDDLDNLIAAQTKLRDCRPVVQEHLSTLSAEHYVLNRMVYKLVNQLRRDKAIASLRQVNSCIKRLVEMKVKKILKLLEESLNVMMKSCELCYVYTLIRQLLLELSDQSILCLPLESSRDTSKIIPEDYLPSRQRLQFHLVRLMGVVALLTKTAIYCVNTYIYVKKYLEHGNFFQHYLVFMAVSARVWYVCRSLRSHICHCYESLHPCLSFLPVTQSTWLPENESLPTNLSLWFKSEFEVEESPDVVRDMEIDAEKQTELGDETQNVMADLDLGVPVQRQELEDDNNNEKPMVIRESESPAPGPKHRIQKLKQVLKTCIKSKTDVLQFQERLSKKSLKLGDEKFAVSKLGKKKIVKKILLIQQSVEEDPSDETSDRLFVKKLRPCLARLIVKYDKKNSITTEIVVKSSQKTQTDTYKEPVTTVVKKKKNKKRKIKDNCYDNDGNVKTKSFKKAKSQSKVIHGRNDEKCVGKKKNKRKKRK